MSSANGQRLPLGWARTQLGAVIEPRGGKVNPRSTPGVKFIGMEQVEAHTMRLLGTVSADSMKSAANVFHPNDVLYGRLRSYLNKVYQPDFGGLCSGEFIVMPESCAILGRFLKFRLNAGDFVRFANRINTGDRPRVDFEQIKTFDLLLPPKPEQERIADVIDELFSDLDAGTTTLGQTQKKLEGYRTAFLRAAVDGKLTRDWRANHANTEPASLLLARILAERRRAWEEEQLRKFDEKRQLPPKNWKSRYKEPLPPNTSTLGELPAGWCWASVEQLGSVQLGRQRAPRHHNGKFMRPYLRVANVYEDRIDLRSVLEMNFTPKEFEIYQLHENDILLNEGQSLELVGRPAIYRGELPGACFQNTLVRFQAFSGLLPYFALTYFRACLRNHRFRKLSRWTVNIAHLGAERFAKLEFPLPPLEEQEAIIQMVEEQLSVIDHLDTDLGKMLDSARALRQAILRHAFRGQLVQQDGSEKPASELLIQVAHERRTRQAESKAKQSAIATLAGCQG